VPARLKRACLRCRANFYSLAGSHLKLAMVRFTMAAINILITAVRGRAISATRETHADGGILERKRARFTLTFVRPVVTISWHEDRGPVGVTGTIKPLLKRVLVSLGLGRLGRSIWTRTRNFGLQYQCPMCRAHLNPYLRVRERSRCKDWRASQLRSGSRQAGRPTSSNLRTAGASRERRCNEMTT
jgi:hypothetical protein